MSKENDFISKLSSFRHDPLLLFTCIMTNERFKVKICGFGIPLTTLTFYLEIRPLVNICNLNVTDVRLFYPFRMSRILIIIIIY